MNILKNIVRNKESEVKSRSKITPLERIQNSQRLYSIRDFTGALRIKGIQVIAEIKRRSPADGDINIHANPKNIAKLYAENGAACISVLTDQDYFGGHLDFIQQVKGVVDIPILRKDFIISDYQVWESFHAGADAILLIADAIESSLLIDLYHLANELGLHTIIETHNVEHLEWISALSPRIIGLNCRDLKIMKTDLAWFENVVNFLPKDSVWVAESGIKTNSDLEYIIDLGFHAILIGSSLMKTNNPGVALAELINGASA